MNISNFLLFNLLDPPRMESRGLTQVSVLPVTALLFCIAVLSLAVH